MRFRIHKSKSEDGGFRCPLILWFCVFYSGRCHHNSAQKSAFQFVRNSKQHGRFVNFKKTCTFTYKFFQKIAV